MEWRVTDIYHPPVKRSVEIAGHKTSISLEPLFWDMLQAVAAREGLPLVLVALGVGAWLAFDGWLESAGGRRAIEGVLSGQSGYPVSLAGEFDVVLALYHDQGHIALLGHVPHEAVVLEGELFSRCHGEQRHNEQTDNQTPQNLFHVIYPWERF